MTQEEREEENVHEQWSGMKQIIGVGLSNIIFDPRLSRGLQPSSFQGGKKENQNQGDLLRQQDTCLFSLKKEQHKLRVSHRIIR